MFLSFSIFLKKIVSPNFSIAVQQGGRWILRMSWGGEASNTKTSSAFPRDELDAGRIPWLSLLREVPRLLSSCISLMGPFLQLCMTCLLTIETQTSKGTSTFWCILLLLSWLKTCIIQKIRVSLKKLLVESYSSLQKVLFHSNLLCHSKT